MSKSAVSLLVFGVYLLGLGAALVLIPNEFLSIFGFPSTPDVWLRVVGLLVVCLGCCDIVAARTEWVAFFRASIYVRASVIVVFGVFVVIDLAQPMLLLFGVVDLAAAAWTAITLRASPAGKTVDLSSMDVPRSNG